MTIISEYTQSSQPLADGSRYHADGAFCATWLYPLGTRLRIKTARGHVAVVIVRDRTARRYGGRVDLPSRTFARLCGRRDWRRIGLLRASVRAVGRAKTGRRR